MPCLCVRVHAVSACLQAQQGAQKVRLAADATNQTVAHYRQQRPKLMRIGGVREMPTEAAGSEDILITISYLIRGKSMVLPVLERDLEYRSCWASLHTGTATD